MAAGKEGEWDEFVDEVVQIGGHELRIAKRNLERKDGDWVDPMFFAQDYTVAAATGFQVWEGARALKKMLEDPEMPLSAHIKGKRVLELGSGTGLAGLCASAIGGDVMLSDIKTVTDYSLRPNVTRNINAASDATRRTSALLAQSSWPNASHVGSGFAACMALDWTVDLAAQARAADVDLGKVDLVLAAECVWLQELVQPFVSTVLGVLEAAGAARAAHVQEAACAPASHPPVCYCCYRDRAKETSVTFAGMAMVVEAFESTGCVVVLEKRLRPLEQAFLGGGGGDILLYRIQLK